jgi:hypothetical protein
VLRHQLIVLRRKLRGRVNRCLGGLHHQYVRV